MAMTWMALTGDKTTAGSIKRWINYSEVDVEQIVVEAEQWIYSRLRVREMLTAATGTMTIGQGYLTLPTRWVGPLTFWITGAERAEVKHRDYADVEAMRQYDGAGAEISQKPRAYYANATQIVFHCPALKAYPYRTLHYQSLTPLSGSNETNVLTDRYPRMLRCACLAFAYEMYPKDSRDRWLALAQIEVDQANAVHDAERMTNIDWQPEIR